MNQSFTLVFEKSTKGTHRFKPLEDEDTGTDLLYLKKNFVQKVFGSTEPPKKIKVTIEEA